MLHFSALLYLVFHLKKLIISLKAKENVQELLQINKFNVNTQN